MDMNGGGWRDGGGRVNGGGWGMVGGGWGGRENRGRMMRRMGKDRGKNGGWVCGGRLGGGWGRMGQDRTSQPPGPPHPCAGSARTGSAVPSRRAVCPGFPNHEARGSASPCTGRARPQAAPRGDPEPGRTSLPWEAVGQQLAGQRVGQGAQACPGPRSAPLPGPHPTLPPFWAPIWPATPPPPAIGVSENPRLN